MDNEMIPSVTRTVEGNHGGYHYRDEWYMDMEIEEFDNLVIEINSDEDNRFISDEDNRFIIQIDSDEIEDEWNYGWEDGIEIEENIRFVPAAPSCIEGLKMVKVEEAETCTICLEDFNVGVCMPCSHMFHMNCIQDWLNVGNSCPLCRFQLPTSSSNE
ncbi:E3 ubiquitin-protein ligase SDIR1-like [Vicia villosa]|uniref:E3 ubiquitin-protein ligase SDIR1-like n=1 Tax=Vicia villosa TaxID=3911 RepID=UPI00273A8A7D|nr:E3 ubiquitin-protein ligase SDIR1-like [Vicia villosa]